MQHPCFIVNWQTTQCALIVSSSSTKVSITAQKFATSRYYGLKRLWYHLRIQDGIVCVVCACAGGMRGGKEITFQNVCLSKEVKFNTLNTWNCIKRTYITSLKTYLTSLNTFLTTLNIYHLTALSTHLPTLNAYFTPLGTYIACPHWALRIHLSTVNWRSKIHSTQAHPKHFARPWH